MKISIITVCRNSAATIEKTLQSVAAQQGVDVEHVVIDGASTDRTMDIVNSYRAGLAQVTSEPDAGIYDAMNKGLALATGDVIGFLNADDQYATPQVLAQVALCIRENSLDAVLGDVAFVRAGDTQHVVRRYRSDRFTPERLAWGWMPAHPALFVRRAVFEEVGLFKTDYKIAADYEWVVRAFYGRHLRYHHVPEIWVYMNLGGASTGGFKATLRLNQEVLRACRENSVSTNVFKILSKYPAKVLELFNAKRS